MWVSEREISPSPPPTVPPCGGCNAREDSWDARNELKTGGGKKKAPLSRSTGSPTPLFCRASPSAEKGVENEISSRKDAATRGQPERETHTGSRETTNVDPRTTRLDAPREKRGTVEDREKPASEIPAREGVGITETKREGAI